MAMNLALLVSALTLSAIFNPSRALQSPEDFFNYSPNLIPNNHISISPFSISQSPSPTPASAQAPAPESHPLVPALFVIGDSSVDSGTNNFLGTFARADRLPYGRDFDTHQPTGRFCNGRIPVDYLGNFFIYCIFQNFEEKVKKSNLFNLIGCLSSGLLLFVFSSGFNLFGCWKTGTKTFILFGLTANVHKNVGYISWMEILDLVELWGLWICCVKCSLLLLLLNKTDLNSGLFWLELFNLWIIWVALRLGLPFVPSYLSQTGSAEDMIHGVNYASAGAGIIFLSGSQLVCLPPPLLSIIFPNSKITSIYQTLIIIHSWWVTCYRVNASPWHSKFSSSQIPISSLLSVWAKMLQLILSPTQCFTFQLG